MMALRNAFCCVPLRACTFIVLWLHLLGQVNCIRYLIINRWYPNKDDQVIPAFVRNDIVYIGLVIGIFAIFLILAAILQLSTNTDQYPGPILNVIVAFILVDSIFTSYEMIMMKNDVDELIRKHDAQKVRYELWSHLLHMFYKDTPKGSKQLAGIDSLKRLLLYGLVSLVLKLYSALVIYSYKAELKRFVVENNVPQPPIPRFVAPVQSTVYYVPLAPQTHLVITSNYSENLFVTPMYNYPAPQGELRPK